MRKLATAFSLAAVTAFGLAACGGSDDNNNNTPPASTAGTFKETVLVSDGSVAAPHVDPNLKNGWGIANNPKATFWVSDNIPELKYRVTFRFDPRAEPGGPLQP